MFGRKPRTSSLPKYTDMHCHILPGLDDGAEDWDDALSIALNAQSSGAQRIVATPHVIRGVYEPSPDEIRAKVSELQRRLDQRGVGIQVLPGSEIHLSESLCEDYKAGKLVPIGVSEYILVELPFDMMPHYAKDVFFRLALMGVGVILAHPERNWDIQADLGKLEALVDAGVQVQLNAGSLLGAYGRDAKVCSEKMAKAGLFHFIGSDAHTGKAESVFGRGADITEALRRLVRVVPEGEKVLEPSWLKP